MANMVCTKDRERRQVRRSALYFYFRVVRGKMIKRFLQFVFYASLTLSLWFPSLFMAAQTNHMDRIEQGLPLVFGPQAEVEKVNKEAQQASETINKILRILDIYWPDEPQFEKLKFANFLYQESVTYRIDPILIMALIREESRFDPSALSHKGACGLMQILPDVALSRAQELGLRIRAADSVFDPYINVKLGVNYLASLIKQFGNITLALEAYYMGPGAVELMGIDSLTYSYSSKVLTTYRRMNRS